MLAEFVGMFAGMLSPVNFGLLLAGVTGGILLGSLPGLTPTMGVAILIPFTFALQPIEGLLLLGGVYVGSIYGGSITAVLLNIPGAPANIATGLDGHVLAQRGEGQRALYLAVGPSVIGGLAGVLALLYLSPPLVQLALQFGTAERFWVALLGITIIGSLSSDSVMKGIIGGAFGMLLGIIGVSTITGASRYTFGTDYLVGGIGIVAGLVGLFAFSQALGFMERVVKDPRAKVIDFQTKRGVFVRTMREVLTRPKSWLMGSVIGVIVGIIPGAGGQISALAAYDQVRRVSKNRDEFGKGAPEGIIAPESANNAMVGASLIPMFSLGIPGSATAAVLLGALTIHGLWPGPDLFQRHSELVYTFIGGMFIAQILMLIVAVICIRYIAQVLKTPQAIMAPAIIVFSVIGAYATQSDPGHVLQMVGLGLLAYFGLRLGFSPAPMVLGLILGVMAEQGFLLGRRIGMARDLWPDYFWQSTISQVLIVLIVFSIATTMFYEIRKRRRAKASAALVVGGGDAGEGGLFAGSIGGDSTKASGNSRDLAANPEVIKGVRAWQWDVIAGLGIIAVCAWLFRMSLGFRIEDAIFPRVLLGIMAVCALILVIQRIVFPAQLDHRIIFADFPGRKMGVLLALAVIYAYTAITVGFYVTSVIFMLVVPALLDESFRKRFWFVTLPVAIGFTAVLYLVFSYFFHVPTPGRLLF